MKLWGGRFQNIESEIMKEFNSSLQVDQRHYKKDICGSIVQVKILVKCDILLADEGEKIINGLTSILHDIENGSLVIKGDLRIYTVS